jgi:methionyl-tRNA formyltransferase
MVAAVMETGDFANRQVLQRYLIWALDSIFNPHNHVPRPETYGSLKRLCRRYGIPLFTSAKNDFSQEGFYLFLKNTLHVNLALSLGCLRIYPPRLIRLFDMIVNYHNGFLPAYRGIGATSWAVYRGEPRVGFAFHRMTDGIDEGNILVSGSIQTDRRISVRTLEMMKTKIAVHYCSDVIDKIMSDAPGTPQTGPSNYFSLKDFIRMREVGDPSFITWEELKKRIHCFGMAILTIKGKRCAATSVQILTKRLAGQLFTSDGVRFRIKRYFYLPFSLYRIAAKLGFTR